MKNLQELITEQELWCQGNKQTQNPKDPLSILKYKKLVLPRRVFCDFALACADIISPYLSPETNYVLSQFKNHYLKDKTLAQIRVDIFPKIEKEIAIYRAVTDCPNYFHATTAIFQVLSYHERKLIPDPRERLCQLVNCAFNSIGYLTLPNLGKILAQDISKGIFHHSILADFLQDFFPEKEQEIQHLNNPYHTNSCYVIRNILSSDKSPTHRVLSQT